MSDHEDRTDNDMENRPEERVSIWSVRPRVKNVFYVLFCTFVLGIVSLEALDLVRMIDGAAVDIRFTLDKVRVAYRGLGETAAPAIMVTVPATMAITEVLELIMVLSQGLYDRFRRAREKTRKEKEKTRKEGLDEGLEKGRQGETALQSKWENWNRLRLEAEERGEPFDVPPPTLEDRE